METRGKETVITLLIHLHPYHPFLIDSEWPESLVSRILFVVSRITRGGVDRLCFGDERSGPRKKEINLGIEFLELLLSEIYTHIYRVYRIQDS